MGAYTPVTDEDVTANAMSRRNDARTETERMYELIGAAIQVKAQAFVKARIDGTNGNYELRDLCEFCAPFGIIVSVSRAEEIFERVCQRFAGVARRG